jgi:hypothetical protein
MTEPVRDPGAYAPPTGGQDDALVWEDPPGAMSGTRTPRPEWADTLMARPGQWARVQEFDTPTLSGTAAGGIRHGRSWAKPKGTWDAVSRTIDGRCWLYARYVGPPNGRAEQ